MKNRATFLICICLLLILLSGCGIKKTYRYMYEKSRIVGIDIVYVGDSVDDYVFEVEKVKTVSDTASFISAFEKLSCYLIYTAPKGIQSDSMAIKIIYDNGNYEIVGDGGAAYFIQSRGFENYHGRRYFNKDEFTSFLSSYIFANG